MRWSDADKVRLIQVKWWVRWGPILVLLVAAGWRFSEITTQSLWNDEGNTLRLVQRDIGPLIEATAPDIHPPGYYLTLKLWTSFIGESELGLRSLSAAWGLLAVAFTYALGARLFARGAGILAALFVACHAFQVYHSQEARMYAQLAALTVMSLYFTTRLITAPHPLRWGVALAITQILGLYTHYAFPFSMLAGGLMTVWGFLQVRRRQALWVYTLANGIALLSFAPWLPTAYDQVTAWPAATSSESLLEKLQTLSATLLYGDIATGLGGMDFLWPVILLASGLLPDWYKRPPSNGWRVGLPWVWLACVCGGLILSGAYRDANLKFLLPAQIALALLLGRGVYLLWDIGANNPVMPGRALSRLVSVIAFVLILGNMVGWLQESRTNPVYWRDDYRGIAAEIARQESPDTAIILNAPGQQEVFTYYYNGSAALYPLPRGYGGDDAATHAETSAILKDYRQIFVVFWGEGERDPNGIVQRTLDEGAYQISTRWYGNVRLVHYAMPDTPPTEPTTPLNAQFGEIMTLTGYGLSGEGQRGSVLGVTLFWQADITPTARYKIFVQLLDQNGFMVAQHDAEPRIWTIDWTPHQRITDNHGLYLPPDLSSGEYTLIVGDRKSVV